MKIEFVCYIISMCLIALGVCFLYSSGSLCVSQNSALPALEFECGEFVNQTIKGEKIGWSSALAKTLNSSDPSGDVYATGHFECHGDAEFIFPNKPKFKYINGIVENPKYFIDTSEFENLLNKTSSPVVCDLNYHYQSYHYGSGEPENHPCKPGFNDNIFDLDYAYSELICCFNEYCAEYGTVNHFINCSCIEKQEEVCTNNLSYAYCDGDPESCNDKYGIKTGGIRHCECFECVGDLNCIDIINEKGFECVEYKKHGGVCYCGASNNFTEEECLNICSETMNMEIINDNGKLFYNECIKSRLTCHGSVEECKGRYNG